MRGARLGITRRRSTSAWVSEAKRDSDDSDSSETLGSGDEVLLMPETMCEESKHASDLDATSLAVDGKHNIGFIDVTVGTRKSAKCLHCSGVIPRNTARIEYKSTAKMLVRNLHGDCVIAYAKTITQEAQLIHCLRTSTVLAESDLARDECARLLAELDIP